MCAGALGICIAFLVLAFLCCTWTGRLLALAAVALAVSIAALAIARALQTPVAGRMHPRRRGPTVLSLVTLGPGAVATSRDAGSHNRLGFAVQGAGAGLEGIDHDDAVEVLAGC